MLASNAFDRLDSKRTGTVRCEESPGVERDRRWAVSKERPDYAQDLDMMIAERERWEIGVWCSWPGYDTGYYHMFA